MEIIYRMIFFFASFREDWAMLPYLFYTVCAPKYVFMYVDSWWINDNFIGFIAAIYAVFKANAQLNSNSYLL